MTPKGRRAAAFALALALGLGLVARRAGADVPGAPDDPRPAARAAKALREATAGDTYTFCTKPRKPMLPRHADLCPLADEVEGCEGYAKACDDRQDQTPPAWLETLARLIAPIAPYLLYGVIGAIVLAIAIPIVLALLRARRSAQKKGERAATNVAALVEVVPEAPPEVDDAELALREAEEHARRGDGQRAVALYLAACLAALERRGAVKRAKHRTNGEYVRACRDAEARPALREVVREVDRATFGKVAPSNEALARVAERATTIVRKAATTSATIAAGILLASLLLGCDVVRGTGNDDPVGDQLPLDVLGRAGFDVTRLDRSLSSLPIEPPNDDDGARREVVVVDVQRVTLEDETRAHLLRWVETAGGTLVLLGYPTAWPEELGASVDGAAQRRVDVLPLLEDDEPVTDARLASASGFTWPDARVVATAGKVPFAGIARRKKGTVVGIASHDLFTNVGVSRPENAAALVALFDHVVHAAFGDSEYATEEELAFERAFATIRFARPEDGIPPPSNPFASLVRAGLGTGAFHAIAAAAVLFLAYGMRQARPRPRRAPVRRAFAEHVEATGAFYERARAAPHALAAYGAFVEARLRARAPRGVPPAAYLAQRAGVSPEEARDVLDRALATKPDAAPSGDELATLRALRELYAKVV